MDDFKQGRLLRLFVDETDRHGIEPLYAAVVQMLREKGLAGATVFRGIEGYGQRHELHIGQIFSWRPNLPVLIEVIDDANKIDAILPELEALVGEGLITLEKVEYLQLTPPRSHAPSAPA